MVAGHVRGVLGVVGLIVCLAVGGAIPLVAQEAAAPTRYVDVSPSVVMAENQWGSNSVCVALPEGLVFVDTGLSTEAAARFREAMEKRFARETMVLVLTHGHLDHLLGMAAFVDVPVLAAETGRDLFGQQLGIEWTDKAVDVYAGIFPGFRESLATARPFLPGLWFGSEMSIGNGEERLEIRNTGGHSSCSSVLWFPAEGVVIAGDLLQVDRYPYFGDPTTDLGAWIETLESWERPEVKALCPGHGPLVTGDYVAPVRRYFQAVVETVGRLKKDGVPLEEVVAHPDLPPGYWPADLPAPGWWPYCIAGLYQRL